jgi:putative exosortase-associated protein (TIGR04073 family)
MRSFELRLSKGFTRLSFMFCLAFAASPLYAADSADSAAADTSAAPVAAIAAPVTTAAPKIESRDFPDTGVRVYDIDQKNVVPTTIPEQKSDLKQIAEDSRSHSAAPLTGESKLSQAGGKMWRGVNNVVFGWVEIPKTVIVTGMESGPFSGLLCGLTIGTTKGFERTVVGALEITTFWHEWPKDYAPIIQPAHVLEDVTN